jgi:ribonuclease HI
MKLFFDGGCRPNPGEMETGVFAGGCFHHRTELGYGTSDRAEWLALLDALAVARRLGLGEIVLLGDSAAVVAQANGRMRLRDPTLQHLLAQVREEAALFGKVRLRHVSRHQNLAGIALQRALAERRWGS